METTTLLGLLIMLVAAVPVLLSRWDRFETLSPTAKKLIIMVCGLASTLVVPVASTLVPADLLSQTLAGLVQMAFDAAAMFVIHKLDVVLAFLVKLLDQKVELAKIDVADLKKFV